MMKQNMNRIFSLLVLLMPLSLFATNNSANKEQRNADVATMNLISQERPGGDCKPAFGIDSNRTMDEISLYVEHYKAENYKDALPHWRFVFRNAPGSYEAVHIAGIKMYQNFIDNAKDSITREKFIDTLMMIYDKRIECWGQEGFNLGRKGYDMMKYRPNSLDEIRMTFDRAIKASQDKTEYFILVPYAKLSGYAYQQKKLTDEDMLKIFETVNRIADANVEGQYPEQYGQAKTQVMDYFTELGVIKCDNLVPLYIQRYQAAPEDQKLWREAYTTLQSCKTCEKPLNEMLKKLYEVEPSADLAIRIADCEAERGNTAESTRYLERAIDVTTDKQQKARLAYNAATRYYSQKNFPKAREFANKAASFRPGWGEPYILIGNLYAASGPLCGSGTGFESQIVVWAAIDMWEKAKSVDPSVASDANRLIGKYSGYMPSREQLFERDIAVGSSYQVGCWINESTTVRAAPR